jgi:hypothetical protein
MTESRIDAVDEQPKVGNTNCPYCHGTGEMYVINSQHDDEYCTCWCVTYKDTER